MQRSNFLHYSQTMFKMIFLMLILEFLAMNEARNENLIHESDKLIMVHTIWTNGERTPLLSYPFDRHKSNFIYPGPGEITHKGMSQHYYLGHRLRKRYVHHLKLLDPRYKSDEVYIQSLDLNITLVSAQANLVGMYGGSGKVGVDFPGISGWPENYIPIPVHSVPVEKYPHLPHNCERHQQLMNLVTETPEFHSFLVSNKEVFSNVSKETGMTASHQTITKIADTLKIQKKAHLSLPPWISQNTHKIDHTVNTIQGFANGIGIFPYKGIDFSMEMPKLQGGHLLWEIIERMREKVACLNFSAKAEKCEWLKKLKYFAYSMDELSISALLPTLGFYQLDLYTNSIPDPSTSISIELWRKRNNSTYVKVIYMKPSRPIADISRMVYGCKFECTLEQFAKRSTKFKPLPNITELCNTPPEVKEFPIFKRIHPQSELPHWLLVLGTLSDIRPLIFAIVFFFSFCIVIACHNGRPCTTAPKAKRRYDLF